MGIEMLKGLVYKNASYIDFENFSSENINTNTAVISSINTTSVTNVTVDNVQHEEIKVGGQSVIVIKNENRGELYLIGTNHASFESKDAVSQLLNDVKPQIVVIELCEVRAGLTRSNIFNGIRKFNIGYLYDVIAELGVFPGMILFSMGYMERFIARLLKVDYGGDMRAPQINPNKQEYKIMLGDRPNDITMKRMALTLNVWQKTMLSLATALSAILGLRCTLLKIPFVLMRSTKFFNVLVHERDVYLTHSLQKALAKKFDKPTKVIGVVGRGHIPGILKLWGKVSTDDVLEVMDTENLTNQPESQ